MLFLYHFDEKIQINDKVISGKHQVEVLNCLYTLNAWRYFFFNKYK